VVIGRTWGGRAPADTGSVRGPFVKSKRMTIGMRRPSQFVHWALVCQQLRRDYKLRPCGSRCQAFSYPRAAHVPSPHEAPTGSMRHNVFASIDQNVGGGIPQSRELSVLCCAHRRGREIVGQHFRPTCTKRVSDVIAANSLARGRSQKCLAGRPTRNRSQLENLKRQLTQNASPSPARGIEAMVASAPR